MTTRLLLGAVVHCTDGVAGTLQDVVLDPVARAVTHIVVQPVDANEPKRLAPFPLVRPEPDATAVALTCTTAAFLQLDVSGEVEFLPLGETVHTTDDWSVGVQDAVPLPSASVGEFDMYAGNIDQTVAISYDRVPRGAVELRRSSAVEAADGRRVGTVDSVVVDGAAVTHITLHGGHLWWQRRISLPVSAVTAVDTDVVTSGLSRGEINALRR